MNLRDTIGYSSCFILFFFFIWHWQSLGISRFPNYFDLKQININKWISLRHKLQNHWLSSHPPSCSYHGQEHDQSQISSDITVLCLRWPPWPLYFRDSSHRGLAFDFKMATVWNCLKKGSKLVQKSLA